MSPSKIRKFFESHLGHVKWRDCQGDARCPFHKDRRASLSVNYQKGLFFCHACGAKGNWRVFKELLARRPSRRDRILALRAKKRSRGSIVAVYPYMDRKGKLLFQQVRLYPKDFRFRRPDGSGGWIWNLKGVERVPYRLPELSKTDHVYIPEGEKDVETLRRWGLCATCNPGGAGKWSDEFSRELKDKTVVVLQDDDVPGRKHAHSVAQSLLQYARSVKLLAPFEHAKDITEWAENGGTSEKLKKLENKTKPFELASDAVRESGASKDWRDQPLRGEWVLRIVESFFYDYLVLPEGLPLTLATWVLGTELFEIFDCFPYLSITSPTKRCGKTRLGEILELLCARPQMTVSMSEAALFRSIASDKPTLIIDEAEALSNQGSERSQHLRAILQMGFRKSGSVPRCVGRDHQVKHFPVYCPKALLAIGNLPDTIRDRSVVVFMRRKRKHEKVEPFRFRQMKELAEGVTNAVRLWAEKNRPRLEEVYAHQRINFLQDREADIWEPLFSIITVADPERMSELKRTALQLSQQKVALDIDDSIGIRLLADMRTIFQKRRYCDIPTASLLRELRLIPESHWDDSTSLSLSRLLRPFGISPRQLWTEEGNQRGYASEEVKSAFERYLEVQK